MKIHEDSFYRSNLGGMYSYHSIALVASLTSGIYYHSPSDTMLTRFIGSFVTFITFYNCYRINISNHNV